MKYRFTVFSDTEIPMYSNAVRNRFEDSYSTEEEDVIVKIIKDFTDCPDYILTDENIRKHFGYEGLRTENLDQIRSYYGFRKLICGDILKHVKDGICGTFKYEIPEEVNSYTVRDCPETDGMEKNERQYGYSMELTISS